MKWEEPRPAIKSGPKENPEWTSIADTLRATPGRWALLKEYKSRGSASGVATHIRSGAYQTFPAAEFDAVSRDQKVYVRAKESASE